MRSIKNEMDITTGDIHPETNCVMVENKRQPTSDNSRYTVRNKVAHPNPRQARTSCNGKRWAK